MARKAAGSGTNGTLTHSDGAVVPEALTRPEATKITIPAIKLATIIVPIVGMTPLVVHKFSEKMQKMMADKQAGGARQKRPPKVPENEFREAMYFIDEKRGIYGFPAFAVKKAMISACRYVEGLPMTVARGAFRVIAEDKTTGLNRIVTDAEPIMRTDTVRLETGVADLRYRPQFTEFRMNLTIEFMPNIISAESLINLLNVAGRTAGLGEMRPEKSGNDFGTFEVDREALEIKAKA